MAPPKTKPITGDKLVDEALKKLGITPEEIKKENTFDVKIMKMGALGSLDTIKTFAEGAKTFILNSPGKVDSSLVKVYLLAIIANAEFALEALDEYDIQLYGRPLPANDFGNSRAKSADMPLTAVHLEDNKRSNSGEALDPFNELDEEELENLPTQEFEKIINQTIDNKTNTETQKSQEVDKQEEILNQLLKGFVPRNGSGGKGSN